MIHEMERAVFRWIGLSIVLLMLIELHVSPVHADWRREIGVFRIGVYTGKQSQGILVRSEPFRLAIQEALGMEVEFFPARRVENLIDALSKDRIEYAIFSASAYALTWVICECVEPVAIPRSSDSTDGFHSIIITPRQGLKSTGELEGTRLAELSPGSISQSRVASHLLAEQGVDISKVEFVHSDSGERTLNSFLNGEFPALLGWSSMTGLANEGYSRGTLAQINTIQPGSLSNFTVIWKSPQIPHRPHVVRKKLAGEVKDILRATLGAMFEQNPVAYDSIEPLHGGGFGSARHARFNVLVDVFRELRDEKSRLGDEGNVEPMSGNQKHPPE